MRIIHVVPGEKLPLPALELVDAPDPVPLANEVVIRVDASGVNPADVLQRRGLYPPPAGASDVLGLEVSGTLALIGSGVTGWRAGQRVAALLDGGGYAERAAVPITQLLAVPDSVGLVEAAALPEALCTAWSNLVDVGRLQPGEHVLVHGGSGGVGTIAVQLALALGAKVLTTAGGADRVARCKELARREQADSLTVIDYHSEDFLARSQEVTDGRGVDLILDVVGAAYLDQNVKCLATDGRLVVIGMQKGSRGELNLGTLLAKRASVQGTTLRARPASEKAALVASVRAHAWPLVEQGRIRPIVHAHLPLEHASLAHEQLLNREVFGKILLTPHPLTEPASRPRTK